MKIAAWSAVAFSILATVPVAEAASARAEFEKYGLLGTYSIDCAKPVSPTNGYVVYRALDANRVQRDTLDSPNKSLFVSVAETAAVISLNEITVTGVTGDGKPLTYTLRIDGQSLRVMQWTEGGVQSVVDGVWTEQKYVMPWLRKCQ